MAPIYFGFKPRDGKATKLAVSTPVGPLEPVEPSRFHVYCNALYSPIHSILTGLLGLFISICSFPPCFYVHVSAEGLGIRSAGDSYLPFKAPGLAIIVAKGKSMRTDVIAKLEAAGFTTMSLGGKTLWLKEEGTRADYTFAASIDEIDTTGVTPGRYLSVGSFRQFLLLRSITTRVAEALHIVAHNGSPYVSANQKKRSVPTDSAWINARDKPDEPATIITNPFEFAKTELFKLDSKAEGALPDVVRTPGASEGISVANSGVLIAPKVRPSGVFYINDLGKNIRCPGLLFKFDPRLACPDVNYIGDVIGRRMIKSLGDTAKEQFEALQELKSGLSGLQLTRVGDELTHFYKCVDIAIDCFAGCIPIFDGSRYEGAFIGGGPGAEISHNGDIYPFQPVTSLKADYLNFSEHASNLTAIRKLLKKIPALEEGECDLASMVELRKHCLDSPVSADQRAEILRRAAHLDFGHQSWTISPANLKRCFTLMSNFSLLDDTYPIGRLSLFETDPLTVALSCFGEKSCPSWDIPAGTPCSLKKTTPPVPAVANRKKGSVGNISDAAWVMVIRQTTLPESVKEFSAMASTLTYRSSSSALAKKVGHRVFTRERMAEFWIPMRDALRMVNPNAAFEEEGSGGPKRSRGSSETVEEGTGKKRRLEV